MLGKMEVWVDYSRGIRWWETLFVGAVLAVAIAGLMLPFFLSRRKRK